MAQLNYQLVSEMLQKLEAKIDERFDKIEAQFVSKAEFAPYKAALNIIAGAMIATIVGALIYLVAIHPNSLLAK